MWQARGECSAHQSQHARGFALAPPLLFFLKCRSSVAGLVGRREGEQAHATTITTWWDQATYQTEGYRGWPKFGCGQLLGRDLDPDTMMIHAHGDIYSLLTYLRSLQGNRSPKESRTGPQKSRARRPARRGREEHSRSLPAKERQNGRQEVPGLGSVAA